MAGAHSVRVLQDELPEALKRRQARGPSAGKGSNGSGEGCGAVAAGLS